MNQVQQVSVRAVRANCLALTLIVVTAGQTRAQQNPHGQLPIGTFAEPFVFLIRDPLVLQELNLDTQQRASLQELNDELDQQLWSMRNKTAEQIAETSRQASATALRRLPAILTPRQQQRLRQIELWTLGVRAFLTDELPDQLSLSPQQRAQIRDTIQRTQTALNKLGQELQSGGERVKLEEEARSLNTKQQKQILATLSRKQQQQWVTLLGPRIDLAELGRVKFKAPELLGDGVWINSQPLTLRQLRGKVVAVHFYAFACINCKRNFPWYKAWHEEFADRGLVVAGIHTPEIVREHDVDHVRQEAQAASLTFPILTDNEKLNWNAWGNSMWPTVYLVDKQGYVRYWWMGELNWQGAEGEKMLRQRIEQLLAEDVATTQ